MAPETDDHAKIEVVINDPGDDVSPGEYGTGVLGTAARNFPEVVIKTASIAMKKRIDFIQGFAHIQESPSHSLCEKLMIFYH